MEPLNFQNQMQNDQISKAIPWNPWHGCHKCSPGCQNCFVFNMDKRYGRDTSVITKGKTTYELKEKIVPQVRLSSFVFPLIFFLKKLMNGVKVFGKPSIDAGTVSLF